MENLTIISDDMDAEELQEFTFSIVRDINEETDLEAKISEQKAGTGKRGDAITIGQILLTALSSGTVVALFQVIKPYFERKPTLKVALQRKDGEKLLIQGTHLSKDQMDKTVQLAKDFFGER